MDTRSERIWSLQDEIRGSRGRRFTIEMRALTRIFNAWMDFSSMLSGFLDACENNQDWVRELMRNMGDMSAKDAIVRQLDQQVVSYVAGIGAVVDHTRRMVRKFGSQDLQDEYGRRVAQFNETIPGAVFLTKLRSFILHRLAAPWAWDSRFDYHQASARVCLDCASLLEADWRSAKAVDFIRSQGTVLHLTPLLEPYLEGQIALVQWLLDSLQDENEEHVAATTRMITEVNMLMSDGATDGSDLAEYEAHIAENLKRFQRGETQRDWRDVRRGGKGG